MKSKPKNALIKSDEWTPEKEELLQEQEQIVEHHRPAFEKVTMALGVIKNEGLYLKTHATFKEYCQERFGFGREWIWRLSRVIDVDTVLGDIAQTTSASDQAGIENLQKSPMKAKLVLAGLTPKTIKKVAKQIDTVPTTKEVKKVVAQVQHKPVPMDDEEEPPKEVKCPKCGKKTSGPTKDWVQNLVCMCDKEEVKPLKIPETKPVKIPTRLDLHPVLIALDNEWVNIQRGLAYADWKPIQIYQKLRAAAEKAIVTI